MSSASKVLKAKPGDVFLVPIDEHRSYVGQIIDKKRVVLYIVIFDSLVDNGSPLSVKLDALESRPILGGLTLDARFRPGMWEIIANAPSDGSRFLPAYKTGAVDLDNVMVESFDGRKRRPATNIEAETLPFRTTHAPIGFEKAAKAYAGLADWEDRFDELVQSNNATTHDLFGN